MPSFSMDVAIVGAQLLPPGHTLRQWPAKDSARVLSSWTFVDEKMERAGRRGRVSNITCQMGQPSAFEALGGIGEGRRP